MPALADLLPPEPTSDPDVLLGRFLAWVQSTGLTLYPAQEEALLELMAGQARPARHAHRLRQVAGRRRAPLQGARRGEDLVLHGADQGAGEREVLRPLRAVRRRAGGHAHRRREHQPGRADRLLHRRGPRQPRPARGRAPRRRGGDGRVPLLRRPGPRRRLADPAPHAPPRHLSPDVGDAGGHHRHRAEHPRPHRPGGRLGPERRAPGPAGVRVPRDAAPRDPRGPGPGRTGPGLPGQLLPAGRRRAGPGPHLGQRHHPRGEGGAPGHAHRRPVRLPVRQGHAAAAVARHRPAPRRPPAEVPAPLREAGPERHAQGGQRNGHPRRRGEHPDPHRALHPALQVRRREDRAAHRPRLSPNRRTRRPQGLRRQGMGGGPGPRARHREPQARSEGRRRGRRWSGRFRPRASWAGTGRRSRSWWRGSPSRWSRAST